MNDFDKTVVDYNSDTGEGAGTNVLQDFERTERARQERDAQAENAGWENTAALMKMAMRNGGTANKYNLGTFDKRMGYDALQRSTVGAGFGKDGTFVIGVRATDENGKIVDTPIKLDRMGQLDLMMRTPNVFNDAEIATFGKRMVEDGDITAGKLDEMQRARAGRAAAEARYGDRTPSGGVNVNPSWLFGPQRRSSISAFGANGRGGFTNYESNAGTGYELQQTDTGTRDPNSPQNRQLSERERIAERNNRTRLAIAEAENALKQYGFDLNAALKEKGIDMKAAFGGQSGARAARATEKDAPKSAKDAKFDTGMMDAINAEIDRLSQIDSPTDEDKSALSALKQRKMSLLGVDDGTEAARKITPEMARQRLTEIRSARLDAAFKNGSLMRSALSKAKNGSDVVMFSNADGSTTRLAPNGVGLINGVKVRWDGKGVGRDNFTLVNSWDKGETTKPASPTKKDEAKASESDDPNVKKVKVAKAEAAAASDEAPREHRLTDAIAQVVGGYAGKAIVDKLLGE